MADHADLSLPERLASLWDHLGLRGAHVATQMPSDVSGFVARHADRVAALTLCVPVRLDPAGFAAVADRLLMISGSRGLSAEATQRAAGRLPAARRIVLDDYEAPGWADVVADRATTIAAALREMAARSPATELSGPARSGAHAGISYQICGQGPALVLLPFFLAPSQWEPAIPILSQSFTVIVLGGRHLGGVAALEDRARGESYQALVRSLLTTIAPKPGEAILDVGCGSGALDRMLAKTTAAGCRMTAYDVNPFLLREAAALAAEEGLSDAIVFHRGNAEALPFDNASFNHAFTVTVLEECDADQAMRELFRVVRPGGRVGVIVRAIDLQQWWHLSLPDAVQAKANRPPQSVGPKGVADGSLYRRMQAAGFRDLTCFPSLVTFDRPDGPIWRYREDYVLSLLTPEETAIWRAAVDNARRAGVLFMVNPLHCAVGVRAS